MGYIKSMYNVVEKLRAADDTAPDDLLAWPDDAIEQLTALPAAIADGPGTVEAIAKRFRGARRAEVEKHLETLKVLGVVVGMGSGSGSCRAPRMSRGDADVIRAAHIGSTRWQHRRLEDKEE